MQTYTLQEIKKLIKEQDYKTAALENLQGERLHGFNTLKTCDINEQLNKIERRLKSPTIPNGYLNLCLAINPSHQKNPDKFIIVKGNLSEAAPLPSQAPQQIIIEKEKSAEVLTWGEALKLHAELAALREENKALKDKIEAYEEEEENEGLSESVKDGANLLSFLKEQSPILLSIADRYFNLEEKKLEVETKRIDLKSLKKQKPTPKPITPGSREHLILIETYFNNGNEEALNKELIKLEAADIELFKKVTERLNQQSEAE